MSKIDYSLYLDAGTMALLLIADYPFEQSAQKLPSKKSSDQYGESHDPPADTARKAQANDKEHRHMNGKKPLQRKPLCTCPPITKGQIEQEHNC